MRIVADTLRVLVVVLFGFTLGETGYILRRYAQILVQTRRLLPYHVVLISTALLGLEAEAVWQNATRFGGDFSPYAPMNVCLFSLALVALELMRKHITRKADVATEITPMLTDPNDLP